MNLTDMIESIVFPLASFAKSNPIVAIVALIILAFFIYRRPKFFLLMFLLGLALTAVVYIVSDLSGSGTAKKEGLIEKSVPENSFKPLGLTF